MEKYDKDKIKESLTIEQVFEFCSALGGSPRMDKTGAYFTMLTLCHGGDSHKLYYYDNTHLFKCFTNCGTFDIFELYIKIKQQTGESIELFQAVRKIANYFNLASENENFLEEQTLSQDWKILNKYKQNTKQEENKKVIELQHFDEKILRFLPQPHILNWEKEGISYNIIKKRNIYFNPANESIIIPHYDENGNLIGIRERTLIKEEEEYGKYRPASFNGKMYNHPLGFALYNLNWSKKNIKRMGKAIVFEGEKGPLTFASLFGEENDISVAACGSSLIQHQVDLLIEAGAREIIVAFDKQFQTSGDNEWKLWVKKLVDINKKYGQKVLITFMFDKDGDQLDYKMSPIDKGADTFLKLYKERIKL